MKSLYKVALYLKITLVACFLSFSNGLTADTLTIPIGQQGEATSTPKTGQSMRQIENNFGEPIERSGAVGEPPITRWRYANFTVYFEHDKVIHAVIHAS